MKHLWARLNGYVRMVPGLERSFEKEGSSPFSFWSLATQDIKSGSAMSSLTMGSDGNIWCTIQNNGLYVFNKQGELLEHPNSPMGTSLVYCDRQGRYWLCTENSIYSYNPATGLSTKLADLHGWGINCMADDMQGNLYVSIFGKGLWVYDMATGKSRTYSMNEQTNSDRFLWNDWIMGDRCATMSWRRICPTAMLVVEETSNS